MGMTIYTIGFTKKNAERFFGLLTYAGVRRVVDTRINPNGQLSGFAKADDLKFFLRELVGIDYIHRTELAPTRELLSRYRKGAIDWKQYEQEFLQLMERRRIEKLGRDFFERSCLLCSEHKPDHCHRRLVVEYLKRTWPDLKVVHLK